MPPNYIGWRIMFWAGLVIVGWNIHDGTYLPGLIPAIGCVLILVNGSMKKGASHVG